MIFYDFLGHKKCKLHVKKALKTVISKCQKNHKKYLFMIFMGQKTRQFDVQSQNCAISAKL